MKVLHVQQTCCSVEKLRSSRLPTYAPANMPSALVLYHYYYPDDVVSAAHLTQLCEGLARRNWSVTTMPCNRTCRTEAPVTPARERRNGVIIKRLWRPPLPQASKAGRIVNASWMTMRWAAAAALTTKSPDILVIGTDPILSVCAAPIWKWLHPKTKIVHWCFDLYPEAAVADGMVKAGGVLHRALELALKRAYHACDLVADIGECMGDLLGCHGSKARKVTLTPWALLEPSLPVPVAEDERRALFGDAKLGLMYSGNFGRAHCLDLTLKLASRIEEIGARFCFSVRGNEQESLRAAVAGTGVDASFVDFAPPVRMVERLSAADIHVVSLRPEWTGTVVPSKFFGAIAIGRPVLFEGRRDSAIARWIEKHQVGWVLSPEMLDEVAADIASLAGNTERQTRLRAHCHDVYRRHFSRSRIIDRFDREMKVLLKAVPPAAEASNPNTNTVEEQAA